MCTPCSSCHQGRKAFELSTTRTASTTNKSLHPRCRHSPTRLLTWTQTPTPATPKSVRDLDLDLDLSPLALPVRLSAISVCKISGIVNTALAKVSTKLFVRCFWQATPVRTLPSDFPPDLTRRLATMKAGLVPTRPSQLVPLETNEVLIAGTEHSSVLRVPELWCWGLPPLQRSTRREGLAESCRIWHLGTSPRYWVFGS